MQIFNYIWERFSSILSALILISAAVVGVGNIVSKGELIRAWKRRRAKKQRAINKLAEMADSVVDMKYIQTIAENMSAITLHVDTLEQSIKKLDDNAKEKDKLIKNINIENSICCEALLGLLDYAIKNGANGTAHSARDKLQEHINKKAHDL